MGTMRGVRVWAYLLWLACVASGLVANRQGFAEEHGSTSPPATSTTAGPEIQRIQDLIARGEKARGAGRYLRAEALFRQAMGLIPERQYHDHDAEREWTFTRARSRAGTGLALTLQAEGKLREAFSEQDDVLSQEQESLTQHFEQVGNLVESELRTWSGELTSSLEVLVSLAAADLSRSAVPPDQETFARSVPTTALTWTLLRKGIVLDTLEHARWSASRDPQEQAEIRDLRQQLTELELRPPAGLNAGQVAQQRQDLRSKLAWLEEQAALDGILNPTGHPEAPAGALQLHDLYRFSGETMDDRLAGYARLPDGSALVEFYRARRVDPRQPGDAIWKSPHYFALILRADMVRWPGLGPQAGMFDLGDATRIDQAVHALLAEMAHFASERAARMPSTSEEAQAEAGWRKRANQLYRLVFAPLRPKLAGINLLYVSPDGELNRVAFESLVDEAASSEPRYLVDDFKFAYLPSGRDIVPPDFPPGTGTVIFADPDFNLAETDHQQVVSALRGGVSVQSHPDLGRFAQETLAYRPWSELPFTEDESRHIEDLFRDSPFAPVRIYRRDQALEERLMAVHAPRVLHIATHGFFLPDRVGDSNAGPVSARRSSGTADPLLRSGIVLAGANRLLHPAQVSAGTSSGWVTAEELMSLDLRGTELVVLSGCDTGLGDIRTGDGIYGLRRAFLYAGARSLLVSLNEIPDEDTAALMNRFYEWLKAGDGKLNALHKAELATMREHLRLRGVAHPLYWAQFVLVGDPN
jgi:CHAT domain-containing protein